MRTFNHPARKDLTLSGVLFALSDPARLAIVKSLTTQGEQSCGALSAPMAKSTATHHFRVLREEGIIFMRAEGTHYMNSLRREDLDSRFPGLLDVILKAADRA